MKYDKEMHDMLRVSLTRGRLCDHPFVEEFTALLDEIERLQAERRWIPVSEKPESHINYLGYFGPPYEPIKVCFDGKQWRKTDGQAIPYIQPTHYIPLPPAPESEGE